MSAKYTYVCATCGSDEIKSDAWAEWDPESMQWVLSNVFDDNYCPKCDSSCQIETKNIEESPDP